MQDMNNDKHHYICDLLKDWALVYVKSMFGGYGIYRETISIGLIINDIPYFRVDDISRRHYQTAESEAFSYDMKDRQGNLVTRIVNGYWRIPTEVLENNEQLCLWANDAYRAALANPPKKKSNSKSNKAILFNSLGRKSIALLEEINIITLEALNDIGAIEAYRRLKQTKGSSVSLNLLWALYACVNNMDISDIDNEIKANLKEILSTQNT